MSDETTQNGTNESETHAGPPVPPRANETASGTADDARDTGTASPSETKVAASSQKKNQKKKQKKNARRQQAQPSQPPTAQAEPPAPTETAAAIQEQTPPASAEPPAPTETAAATAIQEQTPTSAEPPAPTEAAAAIQEETPTTASPIEAPAESLKLRMKVWSDPSTGKRYLMPRAFMRDIVNGQPVTDVMYAYAMRDDDIKRITLRAGEWNALPFFYFQEDGPAPHATAQSVDVIG